MKSFLKLFIVLIFSAIIIVGCDSEYDSLVDANADRNPIPDTEVEASQGDADFTNYVAIGNSLTAGYMDGALYDNGQRFSLGTLLSGQFEATGAPATFNQPDINSVNGFNTLVNSGEGQELGRFKLDTSIPGPSPTVDGDPIEPYTGETSALNNFGVPGIQVGQLLVPDTGGPDNEENPAFSQYYARFASSPGSSTILEDVISTNPTFFSLWIGNNDILGYASSGTANSSILTGRTEFQQRFESVVNTLTSNTNAKGVVANIPPILGVPFFRAIGYNVIEFGEDEQSSVDQLNTAFSGFNQVLDAIVQNLGHSRDDANRRKIRYEVGANPILIFDPNLENIDPKLAQLEAFGGITEEQRDALQPYVQARPIEEGEIVLFTASNVLGTLADPNDPSTPIGVAVPLGNQYTLTFEQIEEIEGERAAFNQTIAATVEAANSGETRLAIYDTNDPEGAFADIFGLDGSEPGITVDGTFLNPDFSPNGVFSTDGIHPNARGNAILANEIIRVIEAEFNATIPKVDVLSLPAITLCNGDCVSEQGGS